MGLTGGLARRLLPRETHKTLRLRRDMLRADLFGPDPALWDGLIFIHVPKAAGSSILGTGAAATRGHKTYGYYERWLPAGRAMPPTFAITRDPYARYLSAWRYLRRGGNNGIDRAWARRHLRGAEDAESFALTRLHRPQVQRWMHFRPQVDFLGDRDGAVAVTHLLRFETLAADWPAFARHHGLRPDLCHANASPPAAETLGPEARHAVARVYTADFESFGYPMTSAPAVAAE